MVLGVMRIVIVRIGISGGWQRGHRHRHKGRWLFGKGERGKGRCL
jgi:hypothetical protein